MNSDGKIGGQNASHIQSEVAMDTKFFRAAKRANRAVEITDSEAIIPAVKDASEIRVPLPNRRPLTIEEREAILQGRRDQIAEIEEKIESERKILLQKVKSYRDIQSGAPEVVVQNLKIKNLMEQRSKLAYPEVWIEELKGLNLKDIFESKRDVRKIGADVFQVKRRVEPILSLYVDLGKAAAEAAVVAEEQESATIAEGLAAVAAAAASRLAQTIKATAGPSTTAAAAAATATQGAIIGQRRVIKMKKTAPV